MTRFLFALDLDSRFDFSRAVNLIDLINASFTYIIDGCHVRGPIQLRRLSRHGSPMTTRLRRVFARAIRAILGEFRSYFSSFGSSKRTVTVVISDNGRSWIN